MICRRAVEHDASGWTLLDASLQEEAAGFASRACTCVVTSYAVYARWEAGGRPGMGWVTPAIRLSTTTDPSEWLSRTRLFPRLNKASGYGLGADG